VTYTDGLQNDNDNKYNGQFIKIVEQCRLASKKSKAACWDGFGMGGGDHLALHTSQAKRKNEWPTYHKHKKEHAIVRVW